MSFHPGLLLRTIALTLLIGGCASSADLLKPEIAITQITDQSFLFERRNARVAIEFEILIRNRSGEPITFKRLDLQTAGGGPYVLRNSPERFNREIQPGEVARVVFSMWGVTVGGRAASIEPVVLSGAAHFESESGPFSKKFLQRIQQPSHGERR